MSEIIVINVDFNQMEVKNDVMEVLASYLKDDPDRGDLKVTLKESLALASKGTKLKNGPANDLLFCILRSMCLARTEAVEPVEKSDDESDEELENEEETEDEGDDESLSQMLKTARQKAALLAKKKNKQAPAPNAGQRQTQNTHQN